MSGSRKNGGAANGPRRPSLWLVPREETGQLPAEEIRRQSWDEGGERPQGSKLDDDPGPSAA
jgi:hypothetical protein